MTDPECVAFLQWCLPRLEMRWAGFRKVRRQVCKRISRRIAVLGLDGAGAYRAYVDSHDEEWTTLDSLCRVTISRFYRDRGVFDALRSRVLPALVRAAAAGGRDRLRCWSAGCASGEEPYTLAIIWWHDRLPVALDVEATDADETLLERARVGRYAHSTLKDLPVELREWAFQRGVADYEIKESIRRGVHFSHRDIRTGPPPGHYDLILCRNLAFVYYNAHAQEAVLQSFRRVLLAGGVVVIGAHERLPGPAPGFEPFEGIPGVYRFEPTGYPSPA